MPRERILRELSILSEGKQIVELIGEHVVLYRDLPTSGTRFGLPNVTDVVVPVPNGYPGAAIDLAGLPVGSPLLARVKGGRNNQGTVQADGRSWQLASYHPHRNGGGRAWDQMRDGFHTYIDHLLSWLERLD